jgi:hypothetical protein
MQEGTKVDFRLSMKIVEIFLISLHVACVISVTDRLSQNVAVINESVLVSSALAVIYHVNKYGVK